MCEAMNLRKFVKLGIKPSLSCETNDKASTNCKVRDETSL